MTQTEFFIEIYKCPDESCIVCDGFNNDE